MLQYDDCPEMTVKNVWNFEKLRWKNNPVQWPGDTSPGSYTGYWQWDAVQYNDNILTLCKRENSAEVLAPTKLILHCIFIYSAFV